MIVLLGLSDYQSGRITIELFFFSVLEEAPLCAQVPYDWTEAEGGDSCHQPGEGTHVQEAEDRFQVPWVFFSWLSCVQSILGHMAEF